VSSSRSTGGSGVKGSNRRRAKPRRTIAKNGLASRTAGAPRAQFDDLVGRGANLWNDEEFQRFQDWLRDSRHRGE
jgi:hypothetical protein